MTLILFYIKTGFSPFDLPPVRLSCSIYMDVLLEQFKGISTGCKILKGHFHLSNENFSFICPDVAKKYFSALIQLGSCIWLHQTSNFNCLPTFQLAADLC